MSEHNGIGNYDEEKRSGTFQIAPNRAFPQLIEAVEDAIRDTERKYHELSANPYADTLYLVVRRDNLIAVVGVLDYLQRASEAQYAANQTESPEAN